MRIKYLDVLKAFAIIAVVLYHAGLITYGYLGVDLFLVVNGYLITKSLNNNVLLSNTLNNSGYFTFFFNRVIRLLPPLLVAGIVCMFLGFWVMLPDDYENLSQSVIATNVFGNNILAAITTKNYWDISNEYKPLMHTWYVGVVMQFYIVYLVLYYLARFNKKNPKKTLLSIISTLTVISILVYFATDNTAHRFYYLPSRFFEFAVGGIAALVYNSKENKPFGKTYVYLCYFVLLALMFVNYEIIPSNVRLVAVVWLTCVMVCSQDVLENKKTGNTILAKIGAASYSIFIWHQILLAFYRYTITNKFTFGSYTILLASTAILSWLSFCFVEKNTADALKLKPGKTILYTSVAIVFLALSGFAGYIYMRAGVVRDIPELYIIKNDIHRGMHAEYCDRGYQFDKPFTTNKKHWYVIGNSFGRDFVNVILESSMADSIEVSYSTDQQFKKESARFATADKVFISTLGLSEELVTNIEIISVANGLSLDDIIVVGEKNFGESNGQVYIRRNKPDYFEQYIEVDNIERYIVQNHYFAEKYGSRFLDLMGMVTDDNGKVRVFSPDHHYISADNLHFSIGGARYFAELIDWGKYY